jgi:polysaccharide biosynthesis protein PslG
MELVEGDRHPQRSPTWANGQGGPLRGVYPPISDADWANFVYRVAEHYRGQVSAWELWNEENIQGFFRPAPDPVRYVALLKAGYTAVRTASPGALVVLGGLAGNGVNMGFAGERPNFLQAIYDNGGKWYFDVAGIHPYVHPIGQGFTELAAGVRDTRAVLVANGEPAKPLWLTEIGCHIASVCATHNPEDDRNRRRQLLRTYQRRTDLGVDKIFWFNLRDRADPLNDEQHNGLLRFDLSRKLAYLAYRELTGAASLPVPGTPTNLTASTSASGVTITWNAPATGPAPDSYTMEVGSAAGLSDLAVLSTAAPVFTAASVPSGTYYIRVRARNAAGAGTPTADAALVVGSTACVSRPDHQPICGS